MADPESPRMAPLPPDQWQDTVRQALSPRLPAGRANPRDAGNVLGTLVRHPELARAYLEFNAHLLSTATVSARVREVAVLRAVHVRRSDYLWEHHIPLALRAGLTRDDIDSIRAGDPADPVDAIVVRVVDELNVSNTVSDQTWGVLRTHFDDRQVLDLLFTIGCYQLLGATVNALGVRPEDP